MRSDDIESRPVFILTLLGKVDLWSIDWYGNKRIIQSCFVMNRDRGNNYYWNLCRANETPSIDILLRCPQSDLRVVSIYKPW